MFYYHSAELPDALCMPDVFITANGHLCLLIDKP